MSKKATLLFPSKSKVNAAQSPKDDSSSESSTEEKKKYAGQRVHYSDNYFPTPGTKTRESLDAVVKAGDEGLAADNFGQTMPVLGKFAICGLVRCKEGRIYATTRTADILSGKIVIEQSGSTISGFYSLTRQLKEAKTAAEREAIMAKLQEAVEAAPEVA